MKMKKLKSIFLIFAAAIFIAACVKQDFDKPPITAIPLGDIYTIGDLVTMLNTTGATQFSHNASVYGIVTMDEVSGNIYKSAYIQDATGAINLRLEESGGLRVGDSVRVFLKGVILSEYNKLRQLSNVHNDSNIVILANRKFIQPEVVTIDQIKTGAYQCKLIKLENVQFVTSDTALTWSDADATTNRTIEDCSGKSVIVRTSNYASFHSENLPNGKGSIVAIAGIFNTTPQLYVRSTTEALMDSARCGSGGGGGDAVDMVNENFGTAQDNTDINAPGWTNIAEAGTRKWQGKLYQNDGYAQATGYNSNLPSMITWLITPNVKMDQQKYLRFRTAKAYWEHGDDLPLSVMVSSNFDGVNVATASWTPLSATVVARTDADNTWIESGDIDLSAFIPEGKIAVAFKYTGSGTKSTSIRVDDVYIGTQTGGGGGGGDLGGTFENPFTVEEAISKQNATPYVNGWVQGYIVGSVKNGVTTVSSNDDIRWSAPFDLATNILIASSPGVNDISQCVFVNMPAGSDFRAQVNLVDNPANLGKKLKATGVLRTYFGQAGLRDHSGLASDFLLEGGGGGGATGGTFENPFTVQEAISQQNATPYVNGWVQGYIVGSVKSGITSVGSNNDIHWSAPFSLATNVLIASSPNVNDISQCVFVNMPAGSAFRAQVNLMDNPGNLGKKLKAVGVLRSYFGQAGLRDNAGNAADFLLEGGGGGGGGNAFFSETFAGNLGTFTAYSVEGSQVWSWGNFDGGCAVMTGFVNPDRFPNDDWLISPAINLTGRTGSKLSIRQAANFIDSHWEYLQVFMSSDYPGSGNPATQGSWTEITVSNKPGGTDWAFVDSGDINIAAYDGKAAVYVAFRYRSTSSVASTWEISKVEVK